jgi:hypothetical protein
MIGRTALVIAVAAAIVQGGALPSPLGQPGWLRLPSPSVARAAGLATRAQPGHGRASARSTGARSTSTHSISTKKSPSRAAAPSKSVKKGASG